MGDWKPLVAVLVSVFVLGFLFTLVSSTFIEPQSIQTSGLLNSTIDLLDNGYNFTINIPILPDISGTLPFPLPATWKAYFSDNLVYFGILPNNLLNLLIAIITILLIIGVLVLIIP